MSLPRFKVRPLSQKIYFTVETLESLPEYPEGPLIELIEGDLYMVPSSTILHQRISRNLLAILNSHLQKNRVGEVLAAPIDVILSEETLVIPDLVVILNENRNILTEKNIQGAPDFVIEILSSNRAQDLERKRDIYERYGVKEYWVIDPAEQSVVKFALVEGKYAEPEICYERVKCDFLDLNIDVKDIFP